MIPFHLARVTNASMLSLAVYLVHHDKSTEQGFYCKESTKKGRSEFTAKT